MGNTNSSPRYRSRSPDPALDHTWSNSYPKVERERNRSAWQQHAQQPNPSKHLSGYPSSGANVMVNGHLNAHYGQFEQECIQHQQQQQSKLSDQQPLRFARYGPGVGEAPVQQAKKIRVLPMAANGATGNAAVNAVKLRATDNGLALQKVGTLHVANRKLNELNHNLMAANCEPPIVATLIGNGADEMRSPTPDYDANNKQRSSSGSRKPSKSKRNSKAKAPNTAPSTPAASAKSGSSSRVDQEQQQPAGGSKSSGRGKLRLFKTKSTDGKAADSESGRIRARSMEYLRADVADETQEVRRGGRHNTSREDLSGDESLLAFIRNGPVTVFSSQKKLNGTMTDDDDWEEMHPESSSFSRVPPQSEQPASSSSSSGNNNNHNNNHNNNNSKPQQFYFGMAPGDVSAPPTGVPAAAASQSVDLDEESRRVMEEFDAVLAENKSVIDRKSETEEKEDGGRLRQSIRRPAKSTSSSASSDQRRRHSSTPPPVIRHHSSTRRATLHEDQLDHDDEDDQDIALSLRPTLPKKPQQLPRFSPSAAWRALGQSSDHYPRSSSSKLNASSSKASDMSAMDLSDEEDEDEDVMEERIAKNALRPVAPHPPRISNEKSADSGISGDAGSPDAAAMVASGGGASGRDKPLAMSSPVPPQQQRNQLQNNWTPQQDLLDDDSSNNGSSEDEAGHNVQRRSRGGGSSCFRASKRHPSTADPTPPKIIPKSQMFNDSSMTDQTADSRSSSMSKGGRKYRKRNETGGSSSRTGDEGAPGAGAHCIPQKYNSLRKLKRSVSGAFATAFRRGKCSPSDDDNEDETNMRRNSHHASGHHCDDGNWMLSRSAPNSVLNGSGGDDDGSYPSIRKLQSRSEADLLAQQHHGFGQLGQQYPAYSQPSVLTQRIVYLPQYDSRMVSAHQRQPRLGRPASMDQTDMMRRARSADAVFLEAKKQSVGQRLFGHGHGHGHSPNKKFTFQSTVRVHEKRLLEEKLSREAELKERKRLQEMQAMQRVEEEFQRKRAREKANIRQQLRVLQLDHYKHQEQLMLLQQQQHHQQQRIARLDPEGAPSSISHHRTSSDELPIQQQSMPVKKSANARLAEAETRDKRKESTPPAATSSSALQQLRNNRSASSNIRSDDVVDSPKKKTHQPQMDYRREVINSSRSRSAATPSTPSANPSAVSSDAGRFPDRQTRANNNADRGGHNNINNNNSTAAVVAAQQKKKSNSNIYRRLAEITSEEESISSPPPVSSLMARSASSNASAMNKQQQQPPSVGAAAHSRVPSSSAAAAAAQHVVSNANGNPSNGGNKVMTQELSEYRQERREYHDFRSPRLHQQQLIASPGRFYGAGQPSGHRVLPTSAASSSTSSMSNNKMQSDNYRWDFAHGGRGVHHMAGHPSGQPSVAKSTPTPPSVATWHHHHQAQLLQQKPSQVFSSRQQHDYHHHHQFYKLASPTTDVVMMHRTPQQRHH
ncbi:LOW QUALITY PROTEIN: uncharacterized protein LOC130687143 [Daphnia carinata]|uniref:LOW QUALITY PROTEIN: uncharacterized protein LOC130687143 n=1 Tax=Daphnia carinata TaxID=120202 RepID=UPI00257E5A72|nr:LOW QUALITY PROTEIN: uncharacterized protein LOC130687143 [Daphnia carinata]